MNQCERLVDSGDVSLLISLKYCNIFLSLNFVYLYNVIRLNLTYEDNLLVNLATSDSLLAFIIFRPSTETFLKLSVK